MPWADTRPLIDAAQTIVLMTHINPDGDAIGSLMGITHALASLGKTLIPVVDGGTPGHLSFIPGSDKIRADLKGITAADLLISVDASDIQRLGEAGKQALAWGVPLIMADHHRTNVGFGTVNLLQPDTASCAEVVFEWVEALAIPMTPDIAWSLLTGIVTDTLCFRVNAVTASTLEKASRLMAAGASLPAIAQQTVNRRSMTSFKLWAQVLPTMQNEDRVIWAVVDKSALKAAQYTDDGGAGGLVQLLNEADGADIAAVFREKPDGAVELHLRAQPGFNVAAIALSVGGGGHVLAAGATIAGPVSEAVARIVPLLKESVKISTAAKAASVSA
jgi:phosphoesterase RecJ-like protein